jgi:hypothetical protein
MEVFAVAGFDDDPEFSTCREQLGRSTSRQHEAAGHGKLEKELQATLESLTYHKSRLSGVKWEIGK